MNLPVSYEDVAAAAARIRGAAHRTPVLTSTTADSITGARIFFKAENLQRMGAFKFRGAYNAIARLDADAKKRGVLAFSSGNHAQAIALAGRLQGVATTKANKAAPVKGGQAIVLARASDKVALRVLAMQAVVGAGPVN